MSKRNALWVSLLLAQTALASAQALKPAVSQPEKPAPADPNAKSATFGDWQLRCQSVETPAKRSCEVVQTVLVNGQSPFAQIAFGKTAPSEPLLVTVVTQVNVQFPSAVRITAGDNDPQPADLAWRRCVPAGCFANTSVKSDMLTRWRGLGTTGRVLFKNALGQDIAMPISFRGLAQALDALAKEP